MEVKEFFTKLKQNCEKINKNCEQCCLRVFCFLAPPSINDKMIDDACLYINQSANKKGSEGMSEEKVTIKIGVDTTELNQKLDEFIKKVSRSKELLEEATQIINSL